MTNSSTDNKFDLIVIGTGVAATTVAYKCSSAGWSVAVIDSRPFGGTCALRGCDPKKVLVGAAEVMDLNDRMKNNGILIEDSVSKPDPCVKINWHDLMQFKRTFTQPVPKHKEDSFSKEGITTFHGKAQFVGPTSIKITENSKNSDYDNSVKVIDGKHFLISSGSKPATLPIEGIEHMATSDEFLELEHLPSEIVFVGGGYISFEFAHIAARAGSKVTILHRSENPLNNFEPDLVNILMEKSREIGIDIKLKSPVKRIEKSDKEDNTWMVYFADDKDKVHTIKANLIVHGAGRVPNVDELNLESASVEYTAKKGIRVNDYLQSISNPFVYSAGDAADTNGLPLTPVAAYEGEIVASNLLNGNNVKPSYIGIPSVVFTIPPIASVGMLEREAKEKGIKHKANFQNTSTWYTSKRVNENCSGFKIILEEVDNDNHDGNNRKGRRILGAHLLGHHAEDVINIFALAIRLGLTADKIGEVIFSYPTNTYDINYML